MSPGARPGASPGPTSPRGDAESAPDDAPPPDGVVADGRGPGAYNVGGVARFAVAADAVVFGWAPGTGLHVLLIQRAIPPWEGGWALPGGFVREGEGLHAAVLRELEEETGLRLHWMEQLGAFGAPGRDPRGRVVAVAFLALVGRGDDPPRPGTDAAGARWFPVTEVPPLAFDHPAILRCAHARLRRRAEAMEPVGLALLPRPFTLAQLQQLQEDVLGVPLDKANFRRRLGPWLSGPRALLEPAPAPPRTAPRPGPVPTWYTLRPGVAEALRAHIGATPFEDLP